MIGTDAAAAMVRSAHRHGPTMRADITALPVADVAVDAVVAVNVLDRLDQPELGLHEARRAPLITLPDRDAVRDFLHARFVAPDKAERLADLLADRGPLPLPLTKRGALVLARRRADR